MCNRNREFRPLDHGLSVRMLACWVHVKELQTRSVVGGQLHVRAAYPMR